MNTFGRDDCRRRTTIAAAMVAAIASLIPAMIASAAGQAADASIVGQVTDESGAVLPGVTVTATSPVLRVPSIVAVTNERGEYRLTPLPIGTYQVEYQLVGFQMVRRESLRLTVGFTARVDVALSVGALEETITVSGQSPVVDTVSTAGVTQYTREILDLLPSSRNSITSLLAQAPGVRTTLDVGGSANTEQPVFRAFGQAGEPWNVLEGVATTTMQGTGGNSQYFDYNSYDESRVSTVGNDAEMPARGIQVISVVKSGTNQLHGGAYVGQHLVGMQASNVNDALASVGIESEAPIIERYDRSAEMSGRILRDRLWFYGSLRARNNVTEVPNCFVSNSIDLPDGTPCRKTQPIWFHTQKVDVQMSPSNKLILFHTWSRKWDMEGGDEFIAWESRNNDVTRPQVVKAEWQGLLSSALMASLQWGGYQFTGKYYSNDRGPYIDREPGTGSIGVSTRDIFTQRVTGENLGAGQRVFERRLHTKGSLTWYKPDGFYGNHEIKAGFDHALGKNSRGQILRATGPAYQLVFNNGVPFQIQARNTPNIPDQRANYLGIYVKDRWSPTRRLTLNLGVRYEHDNGFVPASCQAAGVFVEAECFDERQFNVWSSVAPRLHAAFDISGNGKTVIKGGYGLFNHMRQLAELQQADPQSTTTRTYRWHDLNGNRAYEPGEINLDVNGPDFVSQSGGSNTLPNPDEIQPKAEEYSLSLERELIANFGVRLTAIYSRHLNSYRLMNVLRPPEVYTIPVTRPDPGFDNRVGTADDPGTTVTYYEFPRSLAGRAFERFHLTNETEEKPSYTSFEVATAKRLSSRWMLMASYSATKKNVPFVLGLNPSQSASSVNLANRDPNSELFAEDRSWESVGKISGAYLLPADVMLSTNYEYRSGTPWARQVQFTGGQTIPSIVLRVEPIGTRQLPALHVTNMRLQKSFNLPQGRKWMVTANIYNLTNANTILGVNMRSGATFGNPTDILEPRIIELSTSFTF